MGHTENRATNNHFTWMSVQMLALALDSGNGTAATAIAARCTASSEPGALQHQIQPSGLMPLEAHRDAGATYSTMNVLALFTLATVTSSVPDAKPLWRYSAADGGGEIRAALDFLTSFGTNKSKVWPYTQEGVASWEDYPWTNLALPLRIASVVYNDPTYEAAIAKLPWKEGQAQQFLTEDVSLLLWPQLAHEDGAPPQVGGAMRADAN